MSEQRSSSGHRPVWPPREVLVEWSPGMWRRGKLSCWQRTDTGWRGDVTVQDDDTEWRGKLPADRIRPDPERPYDPFPKR